MRFRLCSFAEIPALEFCFAHVQTLHAQLCLHPHGILGTLLLLLLMLLLPTLASETSTAVYQTNVIT